MSLKSDLERAFTNESKASMKYLSFAKKAEQEGLRKIAKLFKAASEAEQIHARNHLRAIGVKGSSMDNIKVSLDEKVRTTKQMYHPMLERAKEEGDNWSVKSVCYAYEAGKVVAKLFEDTLKKSGEEKEVDYFVCKVCGLIVENEVPEKCPVCGSQKKVFKRVDL
jgi:rubrerythrin